MFRCPGLSPVQCDNRTVLASAQSDIATRFYGLSVCSAEFLISYPYQCRSLGAKTAKKMGAIAACDLHREWRHYVKCKFVLGHALIWGGAGENASRHPRDISRSRLPRMWQDGLDGRGRIVPGQRLDSHQEGPPSTRRAPFGCVPSAVIRRRSSTPRAAMRGVIVWRRSEGQRCADSRLQPFYPVAVQLASLFGGDDLVSEEAACAARVFSKTLFKPRKGRDCRQFCA